MSTEAITRLRALFEDELTKNASLYHEIDVQRVRTEDWQVARFLLDQQNETKAFEALCKSLQWKHRLGIHTRNDQYFPEEFWHLNTTEQFGTDKEGRLIQWGAVKHTKIIKEISTPVCHFAAHCMERIDRAAGDRGAIFIIDTKGASFWQRDAEMEAFQYEMMDHYPGLIKGMYIVDMPWILGAIMKLMLAFMDAKYRKMIHILTSEQLKEFVDIKLIPLSMEGQRKESHFPANLVSFEERYKEMGLERSDVEIFFKTYGLNAGKGK